LDALIGSIVPYVAGEKPAVTDVYSFAFHSFSGDATNSGIFQNSKLHNCIVPSAYCFEVRRGCEESLNTLRFALSREYLSDLQLCEDGTGEGAYAMLVKQLRALGVPLWNEVFASGETGWGVLLRVWFTLFAFAFLRLACMFLLPSVRPFAS
jgi:hypothetical protein